MSIMTTMQKLTRSQRLMVAAKAECDPRSVAKFLEGGSMKELVRERIARAIVELDLLGQAVADITDLSAQ